ncbi:carbon storage regulator CsrA [uncultured Tyzzerella sp.]|uniref:carbon storage regulator CsrA n=1 Tax=uncultured Tyzzerella sp. TaxID=2321398 RepID=UPI0029439AB6|nr:carbon storage regulator CsrA [uncultured Tyzzerella sp.]
MLALSRKKGDSIIIDNNIEIVIIDICKDQVKIGIKAPKSIPVYRKEVFEQITNENKEAVLNVNVKDIKKLFDI